MAKAMSDIQEPHHRHDHHHDHDHGHGAAIPAGANLIVDELDPASKSLSEALRVSFRVLGSIMLILLVAYLASGIFTVKGDERAVVSRLGRLDSKVLTPGLHFSWPFPIDQVIILNVHEQDLKISSFMYDIPARWASKSYAEMPAATEGLRPGMDGALMTSDGGLMHVQWNCKYVIPAELPEQILNYITRIGGRRATRSWCCGPPSGRSGMRWIRPPFAWRPGRNSKRSGAMSPALRRMC